MKKLLWKIENAVCSRLLNAMDSAIDKRICGESLVEYVPSIFRDDKNGVGGTGSQSTRYMILKRVFSHVTLTPQDVFLDVGCGKGRVLAFLIREKCPCPLYGIEHNPEVSRVVEAWTARYPQTKIMAGDALLLDYDPFTVLMIARPFLPKTFLSFVERLEQTVKHPITLIYWVDQQSGHLLKDRPGWQMHFREILERINGLKVMRSPQGYSIWTFDPSKV